MSVRVWTWHENGVESMIVPLPSGAPISGASGIKVLQLPPGTYEVRLWALAKATSSGAGHGFDFLVSSTPTATRYEAELYWVGGSSAAASTATTGSSGGVVCGTCTRTPGTSVRLDGFGTGAAYAVIEGTAYITVDDTTETSRLRGCTLDITLTPLSSDLTLAGPSHVEIRRLTPR